MMHYFKRNIGDYAKKAGRLSMLEHGAYTLLLDACYDREQFPTEEEAIDWCWARTEAEIAAVKFVLSKFFTLEDGLYVQNRVREEIEAYHAKATKNAEIATEREKKRKNKARTVHESCFGVHEPPPNQEPLTTNQEPRTKKDSGYSPEFEEAWAGYPKRPGASKSDAFKAWSARIKDGVEAATMIAGVTRYAAYCAKLGTEPQFIKQPATFFGPGKHYESDWTVSTGRAGPARASPMNSIGVDDKTPEGFSDGFR